MSEKILTEGKYILKGQRVVKCDDLLEWGRWIEKAKGRRIVKQEHLSNGYWISTVFLGLDHNFLGKGKRRIFETMVFDEMSFDRNEVNIDRYETWNEAEKGHKKMVKKWEKENPWRTSFCFLVKPIARVMCQIRRKWRLYQIGQLKICKVK